MPRYKVKAFDGKTLTIDAEDEAALDEAMSEYEASAPKPDNKSWGRAIAENLPFGPTALRIGEGQKAYGATPEGVGAAAGDIGTAAGIGAAGAMLGAAPVALGIGAGALAGAGLEKAGVSPFLRRKAEEIRAAEPQPESQSVAANMLQRLPTEAKATAVEFVPAALSAILGGLGAKGIQAAGQKVAALPTKAPGGAGLLQEAGVPVTPAMEKFAETGQRTGVPAAVEQAQKANPFTAAAYERTQKAAEQAAKAKVSGIPGAGLTPQATGNLLTRVMEQFQTRRGAAVGQAKEALRGLDAGDVGKVASDRIIAQLEKGGVPSDATGFAIDAMTGRERMGQATASALVKAERDLRGATLGEAINYLENFDEKMGADLAAKYGNKATNAVKEARAAIKTSVVEAARKSSPELARALEEADRAYAISQPTAKPFLQAARGETSAVDLPGKLFGKAGAKADKSLSRLQKTMTPDEFSGVQDALAAEVLRSAGGAENLSLAKLKTALKGLGENRKFLKPEAVKAMEDAAVMMETAQVAELGMPNPSGTASRLISASYGSPLGMLPAAVSAPVIQAYMKAPAMKAALLRGAQPVARAAAGLPVRASAAAVPSFYQALASQQTAQ